MALNVGELFARLRLDMGNFIENITSAKNALLSLQGVAVTVGASIASVGAVGGWGVSLNASLEQSTISFKTLLGSAEDAKKMIEDLKDFAKSTPFEYAGIEKVSMSLLNAGLPANELKDNLTKLGDAVAASGGNIQEKLEGAGVAIGQMAMKGKISAEEMQQLAERGLPAWEALSQATGKSKQELMEMGAQGKLISDEYLPMLIDGLGKMREGAMMEQSKTFIGMFSTMKDEVKGFVQEVTEGGFEKVKAKFTELMQSMEQFKKTSSFQELKDNLTILFTGFANIFNYFASSIMPVVIAAFSKFAEWVSNNMPNIEIVMKAVADSIAFAFYFLSEVMGVIGAALTVVLDMIASALAWVRQNADWLLPLVSTLSTALLVGVGAWKLYTYWVGIAPALIAAVSRAMVVLRAMTSLQTIATYAFAGALRVVDAVMRMSPIGLIITALTALIVIIGTVIQFVNKKINIFKMMFEYVKTTVINIGNFFKLFLLGFKIAFLGITVAFMYVIEKIAWGMNKVGLLSDENYKRIEDASLSVQQSLEETASEIAKTSSEIGQSYSDATDAAMNHADEKKKSDDEIVASEKDKQNQLDMSIGREQERQDRIIALAKAGQKEYYNQMINGAKDGNRAYMDALNKINQEQLRAILEQEKQKAYIAKNQLKEITDKFSNAKDIWSGEKIDQKTLKNIQSPFEDNLAKATQNIEYIEQILNQSSSGLAGSSGDSKQKKAFDASMKEIQKRKDLNKITLKQEFEAYSNMQKKLNRNNVEGADLWHQLEKKKYDISKELEDEKQNKIEKNFENEIKKIEQKKNFQRITLQQELDAYTKIQKNLDKGTEFGKDKNQELEKKKFDLKIQIEKESYDNSIKMIEKLKDANMLSYQQEFDAYNDLQKNINKKTIEGKNLFEELENKKLDVIKKVSDKIFEDAQKRISKMMKLSKDSSRTEIDELENILKNEKLSSERRVEISNQLWDKKVDYAKQASEKILDKTLKDIEKAKDADLDAIEEVYDAKRKQIEDIFKEQEKSEDKQKKLDELKKLREQEAIFSSATSKKGIEQLSKIRVDIEKTLSELRKDANEQLKEDMLQSIDAEEESAKMKAEAKAEALRLEAEEKAKKVQSSLLDIATKTGNSMQNLVDTINGYQGSFYKAGVGLIEQFGLGMEQFEPKAEKLKATIEKIKNAKSALDIDSNLAFGSQIAQGIGSERMLQPMSNSNNKTTNYNAPLISIESVNIKDKVDAQAWAKESATYLELATRKMGR